MAERAESRICVGAIAGSFGVSGEVRVKSFCSEPAAIADYGPLTGEGGTPVYGIALTRPVRNGFAARLTGVASKEQADSLKGTLLYADRAVLPDLPDDEYYHSDLIGLSVLDAGGAELGRVKAILNHGAGDLLEIAAPSLREPVLLPFTRAAVPTIDLTARRIIADPPEGIFPGERE